MKSDRQKIILSICSFSLLCIVTPVHAQDASTEYDVTSASGYRDCLATARDAKDADLAKQCRADRRDFILGTKDEYHADVKELNQSTRTESKDTYRACMESVRSLRSNGDTEAAKEAMQGCRTAMQEKLSEYKVERQAINSEYGRRENKGANRATQRVYNAMQGNVGDNASERGQERRNKLKEKHPRAANAMKKLRKMNKAAEDEGEVDMSKAGNRMPLHRMMGKRMPPRPPRMEDGDMNSFMPLPPPMNGEHMEGNTMNPPPPPADEMEVHEDDDQGQQEVDDEGADY